MRIKHERVAAMSPGVLKRWPKVYLAGGFRSGWQDKVVQTAPQFAFLDPRSHSLTDAADYTSWDLEAIRSSDLVFAYFEASNPAGYSLALEIGYAKALGKRVVLIDEKSALNDEVKRYFGMVQECADVVFDSLEQGLIYMKQLSEDLRDRGRTPTSKAVQTHDHNKRHKRGG